MSSYAVDGLVTWCFGLMLQGFWHQRGMGPGEASVRGKNFPPHKIKTIHHSWFRKDLNTVEQWLDLQQS